MRLIYVLTAVVVAAATLTTSAGASSRHLKWHDLTLTEKRAVVQHEVHVHRSAVRWWLRHRSRMPESASGHYVRCRSIGISAPGAICVHGQRLVRALHVEARIVSKLAAIAAAKEAARLAALLPAHYALWMCIHGDHGYRDAPGGEGAWGDQDSGGNGHYGGLQMHPGWGYGTSYHASDDSPLAQMQAAERGYAASGHSKAWLQGQWGQTIGPCWKYA